MADRFLLYNLQTDKMLTVSDERISDRRIVIAKPAVDERSWWEIVPEDGFYRIINIATSRQLFVSHQDQENGDWVVEAATNGSLFYINVHLAGTVAIGSNEPFGEIFVAGDAHGGNHLAELRAGIDFERSAFVLLRQVSPSSERVLIFNTGTAQTWFVSNDRHRDGHSNVVEVQPVNDSKDVKAIEERKFFTLEPHRNGLVRIFNSGTNQWVSIRDDSVIGVADPGNAAPFFIDTGVEVGLSELRSDYLGRSQTAVVSDETLGGDEVVQMVENAYLAARAAVVFLQPWTPGL